MEFEEFTRLLEERIGIGLEPDADGTVHIACGELIVSFLARDDRLLMLGPVCTLHQKGDDALAAVFLRGNFPSQPQPGGILSLGEGNIVFLHREVPLRLAEADDLFAAIEDFIAELVVWRERAKEPVTGESASMPQEGLAAGGFLRV